MCRFDRDRLSAPQAYAGFVLCTWRQDRPPATAVARLGGEADFSEAEVSFAQRLCTIRTRMDKACVLTEHIRPVFESEGWEVNTMHYADYVSC